MRVSFAAVAVCVIGLAACGRPAPSEDVAQFTSTPDGPSGGVAAAPVFAGGFAAASNSAADITGDIVFEGPDTIQFGLGHTYVTAPLAAPGPGETLNAREAPTREVVLAAEDGGVGAYELRAVRQELVNARAPNGGLCSPDATTYLLLGANTSDPARVREVRVAAFSGAQQPASTAQDSRYCGYFVFTRAP